MSVLIHNMEMPTSCDECELMINCDSCEGWECYCAALSKSIGYESEIFTDKRREDCPLVPVPPHGRLIDADAILTTLQALYDERADEARYMGSKEVKVSWNEAVYHILDAPTIIEAEEGE